MRVQPDLQPNRLSSQVFLAHADQATKRLIDAHTAMTPINQQERFDHVNLCLVRAQQVRLNR